jgi:adenylosuccinate synthase
LTLLRDDAVAATCVIGLQWGDEAKGKIVDLLTDEHDIVVRYQGGANAGHTVVRQGQTFKLSLIPSGIFRPQVKCVIANGVVVNPASLLKEIEGLAARGIAVGDNLMISDRAHVIFPWHIEEDKLLDQQCNSGESIGTTQRGIGPCYSDKVGRSLAIRVGDMYRGDFAKRVERIAVLKNQMLAAASEVPLKPLDGREISQHYREYAQRLKPHVGDTTTFLLDSLESGKRVLMEGAQGSMLDVDHGTFPFVTSSNSSGVGISAGSGVPGCFIDKVLGVIKAYTTRVGGGPFPTEQDNATGQHIRDRGNEYGTVTRRPRRCGWFDAVAVRYAARLGGIDALCIMLLDVLSELPEINICTAYELDGRRTTDFPSQTEELRCVKPIYETLPGWRTEIRRARSTAELPANARRYLERISQLIKRPIEIVSVGPDREQTIRMKDEG